MTNTLRPPETAPKNGTVILAFFSPYRIMKSAFWCEEEDGWVVAFQENDDFKSHLYSRESLRGWMPMPIVPETEK